MKGPIPALLATLLALAITNAPAQDAGQILSGCREAYGGNRWNNVNFIRSHYVGHTHWIEQSENPNGPFITSYEDVTEVRGVSSVMLHQDIESRIFQNQEPSRYTWVLSNDRGFMKRGNRSFPMNVATFQQQEQWHQYNPLVLLHKAEKNKPYYDKALKLDGVDHHQLSFTENGMVYRIFVNANTNLISEAHIETYLPYDFFYSLWGKFITRVQYTLYALHNRKLLYPMQWDIYRAGKPQRKITINDIEFLESVPDSLFVVPETVAAMNVPKTKINDLPLRSDQAIRVADGIFVIPGNWFTGWVEHDDGIVVIEAPISSGYSAQLLSEIKKRYPHKKIKGVVVTSDAWPHLAGVREYFAMHVPVHTHTLNQDILERVAAADHSPAPDLYEHKKPKPDFRLIDKPVHVADSRHPFMIYPVLGEGGERMVAVYFPKEKVLYASDLVQRTPDGEFFFPEYISEVRNLVRKHNLKVETVYAMHTRPFAWSEVEKALDTEIQN